MGRQVVLLLPWFVCSSCLCPPSAYAANSTVEEAWHLAAAGQRERAVTLLNTLVKEQPRNAQAHLLLGSLDSEAGQREEAIDQLTQAVHLLPKSSEAANALGEAYQHFSEYKAAQISFERAVTLQPGFGVAQQNLGAVLLQQGDSTSAAVHLDRAIASLSRSPEQADAYYLRAKIDSAQSNFTRTVEHLEKAVSIRPDFAEAWSDLGLARSTTRNDVGALVAYRRAVELDPKEAVAQYRLGAQYLRQGEAQLAIEPLQAAYRLDPKDQSTLNALQSALRQAGRPEEATIIKQKLAAILHERDLRDQNAVRSLKINNEGSNLEKAGDLSGAVAHYREAVQLNPEHVGMRTNLAIALLRLGRWTEGLDELHRAVQSEPGNEQLKLALQDALSKAPPELVPDWSRLPGK